MAKPGTSTLARLRRFTGSKAARYLALCLLLLLIGRVYWFIGSANHAGAWPRYMDYYDLMAEGFRSGHLYITVPPHPDLLRQADPYDPAHIRLWFWDVSLFKGRYYMYWGPVPGLLQALAKTALRINGMIGDQYLVYFMFMLNATAAAFLLDRVQRRLFPTLPFWLLLLTILAFAMANPAPYLVASGGVYQASIAAGQAFLLLGLIPAFDGVWAARAGKARWFHFFLVGVCWALALGSRVSMAAAIALLLAFASLAAAWPQSLKQLRAYLPWAKSVSLMAAPLVAMGVALLVYNKLRFESFLEFGTNVQLSTLKFRLSTDYWLANAYTYLLRPYRADCHFPYAFTPAYPPAEEALPGWLGVPKGYLINEPVVGWLRVVTISWFAPVALWLGWKKLRATLQALQSPEPGTAFDAAYLFLVGSFATLSTVTGLMLLGLYMATMRYLSDVTNGLVLLGAFGAFMLLQGARHKLWRWCVIAATTLALLTTIGFGLLLGYQGYNGHFKLFNPKLDAALQERFATCDAAATPGATPATAPAKKRRHRD